MSTKIFTKKNFLFLFLLGVTTAISKRKKTKTEDAQRQKYERNLMKSAKFTNFPRLDCSNKNCLLISSKYSKVELINAHFEAMESQRLLPNKKDSLIIKTGLFQLVGSGNKTARYFNIINNIDESDRTAPKGIYLIAREGDSHIHVTNRTNHRPIGTVFRSVVYFCPISKFEDVDSPQHKFTSAFYRLSMIVDSWSAAHNLGTVRNGHQIVAIGGAHSPGNSCSSLDAFYSHEKGLATILRGGWLGNKMNQWHREGGLDGNIVKTKCVDAKALDGCCVFDGKHSLARSLTSYYLYSRSNLRRHGGRWIQTAKANNLFSKPPRWSRFQLIQFLGLDFNIVNRTEYNVYYACVNANIVDGGKTVIGLFPVADKLDSGAIRIAVSCDGIHFSRLVLLIKTPKAHNGRTYDMPVDGFVEDRQSGRIFILIHRNVPFLMSKNDITQPSMLALHELDRDRLEAHTNGAVSDLKKAGYCQN